MLRQIFEYHPVIAYRFIPGLRARVPDEGGGYLVRVNDSGFRCNHSFVADKKPKVRRILLVGDSFTAGDGVSDENVTETSWRGGSPISKFITLVSIARMIEKTVNLYEAPITFAGAPTRTHFKTTAPGGPGVESLGFMGLPAGLSGL